MVEGGEWRVVYDEMMGWGLSCYLLFYFYRGSIIMAFESVVGLLS